MINLVNDNLIINTGVFYNQWYSIFYANLQELIFFQHVSKYIDEFFLCNCSHRMKQMLLDLYQVFKYLAD